MKINVELESYSGVGFRIRDPLGRIRILGSVHWITYPDLDLARGFQNTKTSFFAYDLLQVHIHQSSKITSY